MALQLAGIHHLTAVSADASGNFAFYTRVLGLRLVKKTVNQDDVSAYHLFYADGVATPGSDLTFFEWPVPRERRGTRCVRRTGLLVPSAASVDWWSARLAQEGVTRDAVTRRDGRAMLDFEDPEGQRLCIVEDAGSARGQPWDRSPVPPEHQIRGLGPLWLSVPALPATERVLTEVLNMKKGREYAVERTPSFAEASEGTPGGIRVYSMGAGGLAAELHLAVEPGLPPARQGAGAVHHLALRAPSVENYLAWEKRLAAHGIGSSGQVDRYYFRSLYFREPNGILFEIATDEPGFTADEPLDKLGERLALPPFLEGRRSEIERGLKPL
jgi:glyoxalase family protein